jgi:hypothetical protein
MESNNVTWGSVVLLLHGLTALGYHLWTMMPS